MHSFGKRRDDGPWGVRRGLLVFPALLALLGAPLDACGQYENINLPVDSVEQLLRYGEFEVAAFRDTNLVPLVANS